MNLHALNIPDPEKLVPLSSLMQRQFRLEELQCALTGISGVEPILDVFSDWLAGIMEVRTVAFWNVRSQEYYISCPECLEKTDPLLDQVWKIMEGPSPRLFHWRQLNHTFHLWAGMPMERCDRLLLAEQGNALTVEEANDMLLHSLEVLNPPLQVCRIPGNKSFRPH
ncbi:MAG: hypothetical protein H7833_09055 [Magnetococcus sp. DMHC-1]|nr:hypothetical protein [Magnetococcales bacterium]